MGVVKYTGPMASFHCPTNAEIRSLKVHFSPKQEGSGDPSPENVREIVGWDGVETYKCGKNIGKVRGYSASSLSNNNNTRYLTNNYGTVLNTVDYNLPDTSLVITQNQAPETTKSNYKNGYVCIVLDNLVFGETYKISFKITNIISNPLNAALTNLRGMSPSGNTVVPQVIDDNIVCFTLPLKEGRNSRYKAFELRICGMSFTMSEFMVTTVDVEDRTFEPYHGSTTNYEFGVLGKNKYPITADMEIKSVKTGYNNSLQRDMTPGILYPNISANNYWLGTSNSSFIQEVSDGEITFQSNDGAYGAGTIIPVQPSTRYTISYADNPSVRARIGYFTNDGYFTGNSTTCNNGASFKTPSDAYHIALVIAPISGYYNQILTVSNLQLELGSTATAYEPYDPNHTVYGGWVDLITGEVAATDICVTYTGEENGFEMYSSKVYARVPIPYPAKGSWADPIFVSHYLSNRTTGTPSISGGNTPNTCFWFVTNDSEKLVTDIFPTIQDMKDYFAQQYANETPIQICYELATPITYTLAPIQLQTFLGQNNVWSNADYVEVEYDLHETQNILARKQFIIANQPHIAKPAAAPLQNFVTDVPAPLKECKVHFSPVQDLHGYDKPWVGGSGKNLFNINAPYSEPDDITPANTTNRIFIAGTHFIGIANNNYVNKRSVTEASINGTTISVTATSGYGYGFALKLTPGQTYYLSGNSSSSASFTYYNSAGEVISYQGARLNKATTIPENTDITLLTFVSSGGETITWSDIQLELGSTATSYEPYENVCPIEGWDGINVNQYGKNLFNINVMANRPGVTVVGDTFTGSAQNIRYYHDGKPDVTKLFIPKGTIFTTSCTTYTDANSSTSGSGFAIQFRYKDDTTVRPWYTKNSNTSPTYYTGTITASQDIIGYNFNWYNYADNIWHVSDFQIEFGSTATNYEPYNGLTLNLGGNKLPVGTTTFTRYKQYKLEHPILPGEYTISATITSADTDKETSAIMFTGGQSSGSNLYVQLDRDNRSSKTFTLYNSCNEIYLYSAAEYSSSEGDECTWTDVQLKEGSVATEYQPYNYIYGGYVDLVKGEVVRDWFVNTHEIAATDGTPGGAGTGGDTNYRFVAWNLASAHLPDSNRTGQAICNLLPNTRTVGGARFYVGGGTIYAILPNDGQSYSVTILYPERDLNIDTYSIDPIILKTLRGTNNIWSTANGDVEIAYWTH